jgi:uncharacterized membrane protein YkgB
MVFLSNAFIPLERNLNMFFPEPHDAKDAVSKYAGFVGMVISIAIAVNLILPSSGAVSGTSKLIVCLVIGIFLGWLSFAISAPKK